MQRRARTARLKHTAAVTSVGELNERIDTLARLRDTGHVQRVARRVPSALGVESRKISVLVRGDFLRNELSRLGHSWRCEDGQRRYQGE